MSAGHPRFGYAIFADVVGSSTRTEFKAGRDAKLAIVADAHVAAGWIEAPYTITAWDEFQSYTWSISSLPRAILHLRRAFVPWALNIGIGGGEIHGWPDERPINQAMGGSAFENARLALEDSKSGAGRKFDHMTTFRTTDEPLDRFLNLVYGLHDTLLQDTTLRQWETISQVLAGRSQEDAAVQLGLNPSTVSRNLQRGHFWQMIETLETLETLLRTPASGRSDHAPWSAMR